MHNTVIKVCITDDHPIVAKGIKALLDGRNDMQLVGEYPDGTKLLTGLSTATPDVLLLDIKLPDMEGDKLVPVLMERYPHMKIIALTYLDSVYYIKLMMRQGVKGYILKTSSETEIVRAIKSVYKGEQYLDKPLEEKILQHALLNKKDTESSQLLTKREQEILQLIASNFTSQQIAEKLYLSKRTVENHRANMLLKLKVKNAASLIKKAIELNLLS